MMNLLSAPRQHPQEADFSLFMRYVLHVHNKSAFTLVELLVTIAVIAILAALILPAFNSARESANSAICISNLRSLGVATVSYINDHNGTIPPAYDSDARTLSIWSRAAGGDQYLGWTTDYLPFTNSWNNPPCMPKLHCPTAQARDATTMNKQTIYGSNYGLNVWITRFASWALPWHKLLSLPVPQSQVVLAADVQFVSGDSASQYVIAPQNPTYVSYRHRGHANFLWLDGHVTSGTNLQTRDYGPSNPGSWSSQP